MYDEKKLRFIFKETIASFLSKEELEEYCFRKKIYKKYLFSYIKDYLDEFANEKEKETYKNYLKFLNYEKVFNYLLNCNNKEKIKDTIEEYVGCYSHMRRVYIMKHPECSFKLKELDNIFRTCLENNKVKDKKSDFKKHFLNKTGYDQEFKIIFDEINSKIEEDCYYISDLLIKARKLVEKYRYCEIDIYRRKIENYYKKVLLKVLSVYKEQKGNFSVIDYFYITDVQPNYLFRNNAVIRNIKNEKVKKICYKILTQIINSTNLNYNFVKFNEKNLYLFLNSYQLNGVYFSQEDIYEVYEFMKEENLPEYQKLLMEFLKKYAFEGSLEYRRKNSENNFVLSKKRV